jgi:hypothetical protein
MTIRLTTMMTDIIVKIMVEVLSVLALATKEIKQGRFSKCAITYTLPKAHCGVGKFAKKLLGKSEIEAVLQKLDRLTQEEGWMNVAQILGDVRGGSVITVIEGTQHLQDLFLKNKSERLLY